MERLAVKKQQVFLFYMKVVWKNGENRGGDGE
jgi:hypothetical protein